MAGSSSTEFRVSHVPEDIEEDLEHSSEHEHRRWNLCGLILFKHYKEDIAKARRKEETKKSNLWGLLGFKKNKGMPSDTTKETKAEYLREFRYADLYDATDSFGKDRIIGRGERGSIVYRGALTWKEKESHRVILRDVAVKRMPWESITIQDESAFVSEINVIGRLRHRNLVQILGWCYENKHFLLVYEFISNRSLKDHFRDQEPGFPTLSWEVRYRKIVTGLVTTLSYLQDYKEEHVCVVHGGIKPSNILLDGNFNPKLTDFKLRLLDDTNGPRREGYLAPESIHSGTFNKETDIYALGIVILLIASGREPKAYDDINETEALIDWVRQHYNKGDYRTIADPMLKGNFNEEEMICLITVGLSCAEAEPRKRPPIEEIHEVLLSSMTLQSPASTQQEIISSFLADTDDYPLEREADSDMGIDTLSLPMVDVDPVKKHHHLILRALIARLQEMLRSENKGLQFAHVLRASTDMHDVLNSTDKGAMSPASDSIMVICAKIIEWINTIIDDENMLENINNEIKVPSSSSAAAAEDLDNKIKKSKEDLKAIEQRRTGLFDLIRKSFKILRRYEAGLSEIYSFVSSIRGQSAPDEAAVSDGQ